MTKLSDYSIHYRDMRPEGVRRASESMERRIEQFRHKLDVELILPRVKGPDVLDFPIGTGRFYPELLGKFNVHGYDISEPYIKRAQANNPHIADQFAVCSFEDINRERAFDTVVTLRTLNNIQDIRIAIRNVSSILKPGGRWIFNYPSTGQVFANLDCILFQSGLEVVEQLTYDFVANIRNVSRPTYAIYSRFLALIEKGWVPYTGYRAAEWLLHSRGTNLFVCDKSLSR